MSNPSPLTSSSSPKLSTHPPPAQRPCDICKTRKVRCIRPEHLPTTSESGSKDPCEACKRRGDFCTYEVAPKKRGPAARPLRYQQTSNRPLAPLAPRRDSRDNRDTSRRSVSPPLTARLPAKPLDPLTSIIPRESLDHAISVYFRYVYGLVPLVHRPSFLHDISSHREHLPDQEEWAVLVLSIAGMTMAQVPWAFGTMSKGQIREQVRKVYDRTKRFIFQDFVTPTFGRCLILYCSVVMSTRLGNLGNREIYLGANWRLIYQMELHLESSYEGLDCIEKELRRRLYWLAIGFDKASASVRGTGVMITREHCATVDLPTAIDDEFLFSTGYSPPTDGRTSILCGFRYVSRLYGLFGQILDMRRVDQLSPPSGIVLEMRLAEVEDVFDQMVNLMVGCPEELRLRNTPAIDLTGALDWAGDAFDTIRALFEQPNEMPDIADTFLVQQGNIYTAIHMTRQLTLRYRADLYSLKAAEANYDAPQLTLGISPGGTKETMEEEMERNAADLIRMLRIIPMEALAVNGDAVVNKVRFVAVGQLEALERIERDNDGSDLDKIQKIQSAQTYICDFLQILGDIEGLYSITDTPVISS